jgi:Zn-dependent alcohol dehydrogenase
MRLAPLRLVPLVVLAGCTFNTTVNHLADAPNVPPSDSAVVVTVAPNSAVLLGTVTIRGNANMVGPACEAQAVREARKMGATHVIVRPVVSSGSRGVRCTGDAYYLGPIVQG